MKTLHLEKYLDEFTFRYNTRKISESDRFNFMLSNMASHIPYKQLIQNAKKEINWFDTSNFNQSMEAKQGSFGF